MSNRRHLRIKTFHLLYAFYKSGGNDSNSFEKELFKSIEKMYDLYVYYLLVFDEIHRYANYKIDEGKKKNFPTEEEKNPNLKFVQNKVINLLANNRAIIDYKEKNGLSWLTQEEFIKKLFIQIKESELYVEYLNNKENSFEEDQTFITNVFKKIIANYEPFYSFFEEQSVYWNDDIDLVCSMVIKTIKSLTESSDEYTPILPLYKPEDDEEVFVKKLYQSTIKNEEWLVNFISERTKNWELDRIASIDIILLKMGLTEALEFPNIPLKVSLNEYIEIAKYYSTPKSNTFVNGILDKAFQELSKSGEINKTEKV